MHLVVKKSRRRLEVYEGDKLLKAYVVALGSSPVGGKEIEGDGKTPEGSYYVFTKNCESKYHLSLGLSYPSKADADRGIRDGMISDEEKTKITEAIDSKSVPPQKTRLGGEIYIHGGGNSEDWTAGCVAMENDDVAELFRSVPVGTLVMIEP